MTNRDKPIRCSWALETLLCFDWVLLDCETTGLGQEAEPIEIAVLANDGEVLLATLVSTNRTIDKAATRLHQLEKASLSGAPEFATVYPALRRATQSKTILAFNASFDRRVLANACTAARQPSLDSQWTCVLEQYIAWRGFGGSLSTLTEIEACEVGPIHRAERDARALLSLVKRMAGR